ncbi:MAG: transcription termination factor NusA, partial [Candidatus Promineifilaceae bacterium]
MNSEFMLAFNEICEQRGVSKEVVIEALKSALVTAYKRNVDALNIAQEVVAEIDQRTGEPTIFAEKEVVDSVLEPRTEVNLSNARQSHPEAELGDLVLVESTPANFGRIAAQTAKQVILQRVREAEREKLFEDFSAREGEIVNGTVQSVSGQNVTIGLGRTEAILPKGQQVMARDRGERYRAHDKIRVYVLEVRRTSKGPQIIVSRNHRNLLRRLLELEVPEIYNGQVEIKSIAREAGARSKVAVMAMQPGIDPVGACVGMRGVRIQSIVRELNDEKIDVIEWDPDQKTFIAKALSPARVSQVFLEDHPDAGRTASVIVPDDQLSLAIGREGQNARLAAKLTGWRIDIKSLTEAATEALANLDHPAVEPATSRSQELVEQAQLVLAKKAANRPITAEDQHMLNRLVAGVEGRIVAARAAEYEQIQQARHAARQHVPDEAWSKSIAELGLSERLFNLLVDNEFNSIGELMMSLELGDQTLLAISGFGDKSLQDVKEAIAVYLANLPPPAEEEVEPAAEAEPEVQPAGAAEEAEAAPAPAKEDEAEAAAAEPAEEPELEPALEFQAAIDDLAVSLVQPAKRGQAEKKRLVVVQPADEPKPAEAEPKRR